MVTDVQRVEAPTGTAVRAVHLSPALRAITRREAVGLPWDAPEAQRLRRLERDDLAAALGLDALPPPGPRRNLEPPPLRSPAPVFELAVPGPAPTSTPATIAARAALPAIVDAVRTGDDDALREALRPIGRALREGSR